MVELSSQERVIVLLFAFFTAVFLTTSSVIFWDAIQARRLQRNVQRRIAGAAPDGIGTRIDALRRQEPDDRLSQTLASWPGVADVRLLLARARLDWTPAVFLAVSLLASAALAAVAGALSRSLVASLVAAVLGALLPWLYARWRWHRNLRRFEAEFPQAMDLIARAARAGHPLSAGITMVADEGLPIVSDEFRRVSDEIRFGLPQSDAMLSLADRMDLMDVRIFVTAALIQREAGGNLAEVLDNIAETVRTRFALRRQLRVFTAQGRLSGMVLALLPFAVASALFLIDRDYLGLLATHPAGRSMVFGALGLQLIGLVWIRRIVNIDF